MERIDYAGKTLLTGSAIAHALLSYAQALAQQSTSATVTIPVQHDDGSRHNAEVLIGPASQLVSEDYETGGPELEDEEVVAALNAATARLGGARPIVETDRQYSAGGVDDLDLPSDIDA
jgi:hypothetical protein